MPTVQSCSRERRDAYGRIKKGPAFEAGPLFVHQWGYQTPLARTRIVSEPTVPRLRTRYMRYSCVAAGLNEIVTVQDAPPAREAV